MYRTRRSPSDPLIPVRVNSEKHVWIWGTLRQALDTDELVYFPQEYSSNHGRQTELEVVNNGRMCAVPGWSVGLVERLPVMPEQGRGETFGGRRQLEIGSSPRDYLRTLQTQAYQGETGKTLEDFIIKFLNHLEIIGSNRMVKGFNRETLVQPLEQAGAADNVWPKPRDIQFRGENGCRHGLFVSQCGQGHSQ